jgi:hypothetical protein
MNTHGTKNEFLSSVDSKFDEANITNYIVGVLDKTVDGEGHSPTSGCILLVSLDCCSNRNILGASSIVSLGKANVHERRDQTFTDWI